MENLNARAQTPSPLLPRACPTRILALTGLPGAGVGTVARLLCGEFEAMGLSMAAYPHLRMEAEGGAHGPLHEALAEFRVRRERAERLVWIRPFHKRLARLLRFAPPARIVITGVLTETEIAYCKTLGARLVHLTAPVEVRRARIRVRFPEHPAAALELLDKLAQTQPQLWDLIIDTDEPYAEFIRSIRAQLTRL